MTNEPAAEIVANTDGARWQIVRWTPYYVPKLGDRLYAHPPNCIALVRRHRDGMPLYEVSLDLTLHPEIADWFNYESCDIPSLHAVVDDFGSLRPINPWNLISHYQQTH